MLNLSPLWFAKGLYNLCWNYVICNPSLPVSVFYCSTASLGELFIVRAELPLSKLPGSASWALKNGSDLSSTCQTFFGEWKMDVKSLPDLHPKTLPKDNMVLLKYPSDQVTPLLRTFLWLSISITIKAGIFSKWPQHSHDLFPHCFSDLSSSLPSCSLCQVHMFFSMTFEPSRQTPTSAVPFAWYGHPSYSIVSVSFSSVKSMRKESVLKRAFHNHCFWNCTYLLPGNSMCLPSCITFSACITNSLCNWLIHFISSLWALTECKSHGDRDLS